MSFEKIGVTIITGFLGAGKTSLINQILKKEKAYKFAIIENEFSEFGIDAEIIKGVENSNIFELSNGCICCTMNFELQETLEQLLSSQLEFNHLVIETTGIAEPDSIVQSIISNVELKEIFYIDSVICIVDAVDFYLNVKQNESINQIAMSDQVLINKVVDVGSDTLNDIKLKLEGINPLANTISTNYSDYKEVQLIGQNKFNEQSFKSSFKKVSKFEPKHLQLNIPINSISIELEGAFNEQKFMYWMEYFLMLNQSTIYRAKGILNFEGNSRKQIFQAVKGAFSIEDGGFWNISEYKNNKLIFIGKSLNKEEITTGLLSLMEG